MEKNLVLVGGGHAHMVTLANFYKFIARDHKVGVYAVRENPILYHNLRHHLKGVICGFLILDQITCLFSIWEMAQAFYAKKVSCWMEKQLF